MGTSIESARRRAVRWTGVAYLAAATVVACRAEPRPATPTLPARLSDSAFWHLVTEFSEPDGFFRSDNFVSNEVTFQHVIPRLLQRANQEGVYLGVGPDQNFTYIIALRPKIAFIVDIRRQNMLQHLMYKALIELAADRAEFLSLLFSRPRPPGLDSNASVNALFAAFDSVPADSLRFLKNLAAVEEQLVRRHGFPLSPSDLSSIAYVYRAFYENGPELTYSFGRGARPRNTWRRMPTYAELMVEADAEGEQRSYLATEENFRALKTLETNNLVVPLVGDFAGDKALKSVGRYLDEHDATVTAFYTSNVEQYLFRGTDAWERFYRNVATLPLDEESTFIRAVFNYPGLWDQSTMRGPRSVTMLSPIDKMVRAANRGRLNSYGDVIEMSQ